VKTKEKTRVEIDRWGNKFYCNKNNKFHRLDGPAIEYSEGTKYWCQNGEYHRLDGPAVEYSDGGKAWLQNGKLHRLDGPAVELSDRTREWWFKGKGPLHPLEWLKLVAEAKSEN